VRTKVVERILEICLKGFNYAEVKWNIMECIPLGVMFK